MLGKWQVKRSDGTSATVNWNQPRKEVEVLHGEWKESDGNVLTELVGWQADRRHLVANGFGANGVFFAVTFSRVSENAMSGFYRNRDATGKLQMGTVELNRISETEVRSKLKALDGTILTEVFTKMN